MGSSLKNLDYDYLSCEINDISIWFNYKFTTGSKWSELEVKADYLMELFPTQSNVVSITYIDQKKMFRLIKGDEVEKINFSN